MQAATAATLIPAGHFIQSFLMAIRTISKPLAVAAAVLALAIVATNKPVQSHAYLLLPAM